MDYILYVPIVIAVGLLMVFLRAHWFQEKPSQEPEKTVMATVVSKEIKSGTYQSGRSKGGYSYVIHFLTNDGQTLELFTHEIEFGGIKEDTKGQLTYQGRYFVDFH